MTGSQCLKNREDMMLLSEVPERPLALDLRIDRAKAAQRWAAAGDYSLWPDAPFGCSVDVAVWPSVFVGPDASLPGRISVPPQAEYWSAFQLWDDLGELLGYVPPDHASGEVILICIDRAFIGKAEPNTLTPALLDSKISGIRMDQHLTALGYDICDTYLSSMILNAGADDQLRTLAPSRSDSGLIRERDAALALVPELERRDPGHAPLLLMAVYSLGLASNVALALRPAG
ncbi:hypothetical protein [Hoeflea ulvae]|uniref:Uncharacterized protein n=1 Tax=Hoeflea ulvae TaxID=2983764 RepID=A0ABT3YH20_9HYPH|nr:hypothetical protein [Hoeflea ulvae]MCY0095198.1 hypothetical protein [Hoeflea ulvae]